MYSYCCVLLFLPWVVGYVGVMERICTAAVLLSLLAGVCSCTDSHCFMFCCLHCSCTAVVVLHQWCYDIYTKLALAAVLYFLFKT